MGGEWILQNLQRSQRLWGRFHGIDSGRSSYRRKLVHGDYSHSYNSCIYYCNIITAISSIGGRDVSLKVEFKFSGLSNA